MASQPLWSGSLSSSSELLPPTPHPSLVPGGTAVSTCGRGNKPCQPVGAGGGGDFPEGSFPQQRSQPKQQQQQHTGSSSMAQQQHPTQQLSRVGRALKRGLPQDCAQSEGSAANLRSPKQQRPEQHLARRHESALAHHSTTVNKVAGDRYQDHDLHGASLQPSGGICRRQ